jgi:hypothetical protein
MISRDLAGLMARTIARRICQQRKEQVGDAGRVQVAECGELLSLDMSEL